MTRITGQIVIDAPADVAFNLVVHAVREAIYLSPGHGSEEPAAQ